jgi:hypothetical protein
MPESETTSHAPEYTATVTELPVRLVRCACEACGAHINAVWSFRVGGSCPTCGSFRLVPVAGAAVMTGAELVA